MTKERERFERWCEGSGIREGVRKLYWFLSKLNVLIAIAAQNAGGGAVTLTRDDSTRGKDEWWIRLAVCWLEVGVEAMDSFVKKSSKYPPVDFAGLLGLFWRDNPTLVPAAADFTAGSLWVKDNLIKPLRALVSRNGLDGAATEKLRHLLVRLCDCVDAHSPRRYGSWSWDLEDALTRLKTWYAEHERACVCGTN